MDKSLLGKLPAELRNEIYGLLLPPSATLKINVYRGAPQGVTSEPNKDIFALAGTCREVAAEALDMFYGHHNLVITIQPYYLLSGSRRLMTHAPRPLWVKQLHGFLQSSGSGGPKAVRSVEVVIRGNVGTTSATKSGREETRSFALPPRLDGNMIDELAGVLSYAADARYFKTLLMAATLSDRRSRREGAS